MKAVESEGGSLVLLDDLRRLCESVLTNADAYVSLDECSDTIRITFVTSSEEVTFECSGFHLFQVVKDHTDASGLMVGETRVTAYSSVSEIRRLMSSTGWSWQDVNLPKELFLIETRGAVELRILCTRFGWHRRSD